jgi:hypothetical protein
MTDFLRAELAATGLCGIVTRVERAEREAYHQGVRDAAEVLRRWHASGRMVDGTIYGDVLIMTEMPEAFEKEKGATA